MKIKNYALCLLILVLVLSACRAPHRNTEPNDQDKKAEEATSMEEGKSEKAGSKEVIKVTMINTEGEEIGTAQLEQKAKGVNIEIEASDLPKGAHGFHIHEHGICEKPDFKSAGDHFNPTQAKHGFDNPEGPHAGDLPNLEVGADGKVEESFLNEMVTLKKGEANSLLKEGGTSLIIHADPDDNISQPAGNAGARIACGVISQ